MSGSHPLVQLARKTIETYIREGKVLDSPEELSPEMKRRAGVFVSLHKKEQLRGCIGTLAPTQNNVAEEVIRNAISSATQDPRFPPVRPSELDQLEISVDVLSEPEPIENLDELDPKRYGVIAQKGFRRGLLLPDLPTVNTVEEQVRIVCQKAWIDPEEDGVQLLRFTVKRYE